VLLISIPEIETNLKNELKGYNGGLTGERGLLIAVLIRARLDLESREIDIRSHALRWFISKSQDPFSLKWICDHLEYPAEDLCNNLKRQGLL